MASLLHYCAAPIPGSIAADLNYWRGASSQYASSGPRGQGRIAQVHHQLLDPVQTASQKGKFVVVTCLLHREKGLDVWEGIFIALETRESKQLRLAEAESTTNTNLTRGSRLAAVQGTRFFPGNTPGRRPRNSEPEQVTNQTRGRPGGEDRSAALL